MKIKLLGAMLVLLMALSLVPTVTAGTITISDVTITPEYPQEGDTVHFKAKVTADGNIESVRLYPCWEQPSYTCGMPATMTDNDGDGYYEGEYSHDAWTDGNIIHANITAKDDSGGEETYSMIFEIGKDPPNGGDKCKDDYTKCTNEKECEDNGYYWWDDACHDRKKEVGDYTDETSCEGAGYYWYDNKCNENVGPPTVYKTKEDCTGVGYYWWDGKCNEKKKPDEPKGFIPGFGLIGVLAAVVTIGILSRARR